MKISSSTSSGTCTTVIGTATSSNSIAIGHSAVATSGTSVAIGRSATTSGTSSVTIGHSAVAMLLERISVPPQLQAGDAFRTDQDHSVAIFLDVDKHEHLRCIRDGEPTRLIIDPFAENKVTIVSRICDCE